MVLIWDTGDSPPRHFDGSIYLWSSLQDDFQQNIHSIPRFVELNAEKLRSEYLSYVYQLGENEHKKKRVVSHLKIRPGFSYWWMTLLAEKCNHSKSPLIVDAIKFLALMDMLQGHQVREVKLASNNTVLYEVLQDWCDKNDICLNGIQQVQSKSVKKQIVKVFYKRLTVRVQAFFWLFYHLFNSWPLSGIGAAEWRKSNATTSFVSYLFNLVPSAAEQGRYESRYWAYLPNDMASEGHAVRWLHLWVKDKVAPSAKIVKQLIERFNSEKSTGHVHVTLDSFLSPLVVLNTLMDWLQLQWKARKVEAVLGKYSRDSVNLWPFMRQDWWDSIGGPTAIKNLLMLNLFEVAFADIPKQSQGCYLQENQGWEFGCISAWRNAGHNDLSGVPHSTVRYWDLRYFFDPRCYNTLRDFGLPLPSRVAVNGPIAKQTYLDGGYPSEEVIEVEALRYLHLASDEHQQKNALNQSQTNNSLLVLGDYSVENTLQQMKLLEGAAKSLEGWEVMIKPHPACPVDLTDYPQLAALHACITDKPINEVLPDFRVVYSSLTTSAAVDAYCAGLSVISVLDPSVLNLSPLRGMGGVELVSNSDELLIALRNDTQQTEPKQYFNIDSDLPRWRKLLSMKG